MSPRLIAERRANNPKRDAIEFTPVHGLMALGRKLAAHLGIEDIWHGEDGIEGVMRQKLKELKVPEKVSVKAQDVSVRGIAENAGFIKRPRAHRRLKGK